MVRTIDEYLDAKYHPCQFMPFVLDGPKSFTLSISRFSSMEWSVMRMAVKWVNP